MVNYSILIDVILVSAVAGFSTGIGALPVLFVKSFSHRFYDGMVALAAGVMVGASMFTLVIPGLNIDSAPFYPFGLEIGNMPQVMAGVILGGLFLLTLDQYLVRYHVGYSDGSLNEKSKKALLVGGSITLHNFPEGLAIGIAFGSGLEGLGLAMGLAIGVQNIPDGFALAVPSNKAGIPKLQNLVYTSLSGGIPEPIAAVLGFGLVQTFTRIFPISAGLAAGAMLAVVFKEMVPESHGHGYELFSTFMFLLGFIIMLYIDKTFAV